MEPRSEDLAAARPSRLPRTVPANGANFADRANMVTRRWIATRPPVCAAYDLIGLIALLALALFLVIAASQRDKAATPEARRTARTGEPLARAQPSPASIPDELARAFRPLPTAPPDSDALRTHIHSLRMVLDKPFRSPMLQTVPGLGYKVVKPHA